MRTTPISITLCLAAACSASGCALVSPTPTLELLKATGTAASYMLARGPATATQTVYHPHAAPRALCIELNRESQTADVVPALQAELQRHRIDSRVYDSGTPAVTCPVWLRYTAYVEWDLPPFGSEYRSYLARAALTLHTAEGRVLASSAYEPSGAFEIGKWAPTRDKLAPVVTAIVTGVEN